MSAEIIALSAFLPGLALGAWIGLGIQRAGVPVVAPPTPTMGAALATITELRGAVATLTMQLERARGDAVLRTHERNAAWRARDEIRAELQQTAIVLRGELFS